MNVISADGNLPAPSLTGGDMSSHIRHSLHFRPVAAAQCSHTGREQRKRFSSPLELSQHIVAALRNREVEMAEEDLDQDPDERLPPTCRRRVEALRRDCPVGARHLVSWFSDPACRMEGGLSFLLGDPPQWLVEAGYLAWEAISDYMDAYGIPGSDVPRQKAVEAGLLIGFPPRSGGHAHQPLAGSPFG